MIMVRTKFTQNNLQTMSILILFIYIKKNKIKLKKKKEAGPVVNLFDNGKIQQ